MGRRYPIILSHDTPFKFTFFLVIPFKSTRTIVSSTQGAVSLKRLSVYIIFHSYCLTTHQTQGYLKFNPQRLIYPLTLYSFKELQVSIFSFLLSLFNLINFLLLFESFKNLAGILLLIN